ncbi:1-acylglycerol-3-phosphate O-acyltransferase [Marinomonas sp. 2405UD68-3]|uniref:1-acylglycerol-3-phosphate O-acyltransferase n=1 Tax=Marinomonas sp. 2405UD68-3 TaxID=3391835 RepID=UPI0039C8D75E
MQFVLGIFLLLTRSLFLLFLLLFITCFGLIFFLFFSSSFNKVYYITHAFTFASRVLGIQVQPTVSDNAGSVGQAVYVANHQNNMDLFIFPSVFPKKTVTVGKKSIIWIPLFGLLYWASGNILINRNNRQKAIATIDQIVDQMNSSHLSIWMFPEGTRSRGRGLLPFKAGAFHAAVQAGLPVVPVVCSNTHNQIKLSRWNNGTVKVEMLPPISTKNMSLEEVTMLMEQCHQQMENKLAELSGKKE